MNGWHTYRIEGWPPTGGIHPVFEGFHIAEEKMLDSKSTREYLKKYSPIYCRDTHTANLLNDRGIPACFGGCPTLTLSPGLKKNSGKVLVIDAHLDFGTGALTSDTKKHFLDIVPESIQREAVYLSQHVDRSDSFRHGYKLFMAQKRLKELENAKLVITNRLHVALPCLAFQTPCLFIHENAYLDKRLADYIPHIHHSSTTKPLATFDWCNPKSKPIPSYVKDLRERIMNRLVLTD
jgi:hypothetical protein